MILILNHLCRVVVLQISRAHMLQTSSSNQMHVLVASNNISLSRLEGRIYIPVITLLHSLPVLIILLNPLPVLVALKILQDILPFTHSAFMINICPLVGCLEDSDRKVKQFCFIPRIASSSSSQCPKCMCLVLQHDSQFVSRKLSRNRHCAD